MTDHDSRTDWTSIGIKPQHQPRPVVVPLVPAGSSPYAERALADEVAGVLAEPEGSRNDRLNVAAFNLGQLVGGGQLAEQRVVDALDNAGLSAGLTAREVGGTIRSGMRKGKLSPRYAPPSLVAGPDVTEVAAAELLGRQGADFWASSMAVAHVREYALSRLCSPWAVLGVVLLRVLATVPPNVTLPPLIGGPGSLNAFVALVGSSGVGKGAAEAAAGQAVELGDVYSAPVGSGEGIAHQYAHREKGGVVRDRDAVLFTVSEVDTLTALGQRQGSTLLGQLRSAFSGERLGFGYADALKRLPIDRHTYRLGLIVGVQPEKAGPLLDDADGGTPQRFIWLPAHDRAICADPAPAPPPLVIDPQRWPLGDVVLSVPERVAVTVQSNHVTRARGEGQALDGHALFARMKVAQALTLLDGRRTMTDDDWHRSAVVMAMSDLTRARIAGTLHQRAQAGNVGRAKAEGMRQVVVADTVATAAVQRVAKRLGRLVVDDGPMAWAEARRLLASRDREHFEDAVALLVEQGAVGVEVTPEGRRLVAK